MISLLTSTINDTRLSNQTFILGNMKENFPFFGWCTLTQMMSNRWSAWKKAGKQINECKTYIFDEVRFNYRMTSISMIFNYWLESFRCCLRCKAWTWCFRQLFYNSHEIQHWLFSLSFERILMLAETEEEYFIFTRVNCSSSANTTRSQKYPGIAWNVVTWFFSMSSIIAFSQIGSFSHINVFCFFWNDYNDPFRIIFFVTNINSHKNTMSLRESDNNKKNHCWLVLFSLIFQFMHYIYSWQSVGHSSLLLH